MWMVGLMKQEFIRISPKDAGNIGKLVSMELKQWFHGFAGMRLMLFMNNGVNLSYIK